MTLLLSRDLLVTRHRCGDAAALKLLRFRGRGQMSHNDEVCTSDPDELEIILALRPEYWQKLLLQLSPQTVDDRSVQLSQTPIPRSQPFDDSPRPRKRVKVCFKLKSLISGETQSSSSSVKRHRLTTYLRATGRLLYLYHQAPKQPRTPLTSQQLLRTRLTMQKWMKTNISCP